MCGMRQFMLQGIFVRALWADKVDIRTEYSHCELE
jgi:hypothetical protein